MPRLSAARNNIYTQIVLRNRKQVQTNSNLDVPYNVFISHRTVDTKRNIAGLLYSHLRHHLHLRPFLDNKNMKPGDKLFEEIDMAIRQCKIRIPVFSPHYCESYFCLHELSLMVEARKKIIPIFCDLKPSELRVKDNGIHLAKDLGRFQMALREAKYTVGLAFDTLRGDWSEFLARASDAVVENLVEVQDEERRERKINGE